MKNKLHELRHNDSFMSISSSMFAILGGMLFGLIIMLFTNAGEALPAFRTILFGALKSAKSMGNVLYFAAPIILTGLSVGFAFRTGLFNIGATGQFTVGAFVAIYIGVKWTFLPAGIHALVAIVFAMIAGALWAMIPGLLKAYRNVHEVVSTIMMNYIAMYLTKLLVFTTVFNQAKNESLPVAKTAKLPTFGLDKIFTRSPVNSGIFIAILAAVVIYFILFKTTFGYELRAVGYNRNAAKYAGIKENKKIVYSMMIAGALAGLAGAVVYLGGGKHLEITAVLLPEGFDGIPVALLANSHPIGVVFAGLFIAYIKVSGFYMQLHNFTPEIINIIVASIIYFSALSLMFRTFVSNLLTKLFAGGAK